VAGSDEQMQDDLPFRQVTRDLPTPCWISDADGNIIWVNEAWLSYTGKSPEVLAAEGLRGLHHPDRYEEVARRWEETKSVGQPVELVFPLKGVDGRFRPFLTRVVPLRDTSGRITRWFGTNTDVSLLAEAEARARRSEAALRENEARLRLATDAAAVGVWEWRLDTNQMIYSPRARAICGFTEDEPLDYDRIVAVTHPEDFPRTSAQAARALDPQVRDHSPYEYRIIRPSGEVRWVSAFGEAIFESQPDGTVRAVRYVGTLLDITERRQAEDQLRNSEAELRLSLRVGRMAAWRVDGKGRLSASPELNLLVGLPPDARPTFEELAEHYLPGELDRIRAEADAARKSGQRHFEIEYRFRRMDGMVRWFYARAEALVGENGEPDGVIGIVGDITERKADEERLQVLAREVDHRANNLLTVVEAVIALSRAEDIAAMREVISGRIHALARAHQLLSDSRWTGANLRRLVEEELTPFGLTGSTSPFIIEGPSVGLSPAAAQALAMVLHELATNAVKHGALGAPTGRVAVTWTAAADGRLQLVWAERGGPRVTAPARRGFGTNLIERAFGGILQGEARLQWPPEGLTCEISLQNDEPLKDHPTS
jgi:PAS domain S-box-containing protein